MWFKSLNDLPAISSRPPVLSAAHPAKRVAAVAPVAVDISVAHRYIETVAAWSVLIVNRHTGILTRGLKSLSQHVLRHKTDTTLLKHVEVGGENNMFLGGKALA